MTGRCDGEQMVFGSRHAFRPPLLTFFGGGTWTYSFTYTVPSYTLDSVPSPRSLIPSCYPLSPCFPRHLSTMPARPTAHPSLPTPSSLLLRYSLYLPLGIATVYLTFFLALLTPLFQRHFIFLHAIQFPFSPSYDKPEKYGLAPFKTRPLTLTTRDGESIGAWHVLPEVYYQRRASSTSTGASFEGWDEDVYGQAMKKYPTIIYLHGNSMNRAAPFRIAAYQSLTSRIDANVVAIDYRGFGDSSGTPSEAGLVEDAETAYRWIREQQAGTKQRITVFGQSLGTGIGALLAAKLDREGSEGVEGLVLMAPYTDLKSLVKDFRIGGLVPLLRPIGAIPLNEGVLPLPLRIRHCRRTEFAHSFDSCLDSHTRCLPQNPSEHHHNASSTHRTFFHASNVHRSVACTRRPRHPHRSLATSFPDCAQSCRSRVRGANQSPHKDHCRLRPCSTLPTRFGRPDSDADRNALWWSQPVDRGRVGSCSTGFATAVSSRGVRMTSPTTPYPHHFDFQDLVLMEGKIQIAKRIPVASFAVTDQT